MVLERTTSVPGRSRLAASTHVSVLLACLSDPAIEQRIRLAAFRHPLFDWYDVGMSDVTRILNQLDQGDHSAADQLLPLVYDELRRLAKQRMKQENPAHTLQATALVHEAYVRLVDTEQSQEWDSRGHFFSAAAEAMRRILIENARQRNSQKRGGQHEIQPLHDGDALVTANYDELMELNEAIERLIVEDEPAAEVAKLRLFAGLSVAEVGDVLGISRTTAFRRWSYAQAWLTAEMADNDD